MKQNNQQHPAYTDAMIEIGLGLSIIFLGLSALGFVIAAVNHHSLPLANGPKIALFAIWALLEALGIWRWDVLRKQHKNLKDQEG